MTNKASPTFGAILIFVAWPTILISLAVFVLRWQYGLFINPPKADLLGSLLSGIIGYSATAAFFFLALPRVGYFRVLDKKKHFVPYALAILLPGIVGLITQIMLYVLDVKSGLFDVFWVHLALSSTLVQFSWSLIILFKIVLKVRKAG